MPGPCRRTASFPSSANEGSNHEVMSFLGLHRIDSVRVHFIGPGKKPAAKSRCHRGHHRVSPRQWLALFACLHVVQLFLLKAYIDRRISWIAAVLMLGLVMAAAGTGYSLPWDARAFFSTRVAEGLMAGLPFGGRLARLWLLGGNEISTITLSPAVEAPAGDRRAYSISNPHPWRRRRAEDPAYFKFYRDRYGASDSDAAGWFTSACSPLVYLDHALPGLHGHYFVCEPAGNLSCRAPLSGTYFSL